MDPVSDRKRSSKKSAGYKAIYKNQRSSALFGLCWCEMSLHNFTKASEHCEKAVAIDAEDGVAQNLLGTVYLELLIGTIGEATY